jgi:hypothetical protein
MAYKRTSKKTGTNSRRTTTMNSSGAQKITNSVKSGNTTTSYTTNGGKSYMTQTTRSADGFIARRRIGSTSPKRGKRSKKDDAGAGMGIIIILCIIGVIANWLGFV